MNHENSVAYNICIQQFLPASNTTFFILDFRCPIRKLLST